MAGISTFETENVIIDVMNMLRKTLFLRKYVYSNRKEQNNKRQDVK